MGFFSWLARKGTAGETARVVGQQYRLLKEENPTATDADIFQAILAARHAAKPYTEWQLAKLRLSAYHLESVADFVLQLIVNEANLEPHELGEAQANSLSEAISRELLEIGLR